MISHSKKSFSALLTFIAVFASIIFLSSCTSSTLPTGLTAPMDQSGATLDRNEALQLINQFRVSRGAPVLVQDPALNAMAQNLANQYATNSTRPDKPGQNIAHMRLSAGYSNFAHTFSGWRGSPPDAQVIADTQVSRAGIAVAYSPNSSYGVHWVLLLARPNLPPAPTPAQ